MDRGPIMIFGLGELGGYTLEFLSRVPNITKIVTVDNREEWGQSKTNSAIAGASYFELYPDIEFVHLDAFDVNETANLIKKNQPAIIFNAMTLQSWWVIAGLPTEKYNSIDEARFAPWFPMHFLPAYRLMQAVHKSKVSTKVVNGAFPDLVNPVLGKIGLRPTVGIGNIDNMVSQSRLVTSRVFDVPLRSIVVYLVLPHIVSYYAMRYGSSGGAPYYLKIMIDDKDVTSELNKENFLKKLTTIGRIPGSIHANPIVASSVCRIILGILFDTKQLSHAPGPNGLPGGYPVKLRSEGVEVFLPEGLSLAEAVQINSEANIFEGIQSIEDDGTVILTDKSAGIFKRLLDFDCKVYRVKEVGSKAAELGEKFKKWAES